MAIPNFTGTLISDRTDFEGELPGAIHYGIQGPPGPAGADGTVDFENLTPEQIERLRGPKGPSGKTAYEYALDGGYTGSETDFVTKLTTEYLPLSGGDMTGELKMNGQPISGLNDPTANDHAANMGFVNQQVRKAAPRNLLDNSDFRNPVNQRGQTSHTTSGYTIDRWKLETVGDSGVSLSDDGITFGATNSLVLFVQTLSETVRKQLIGRTVTLAATISTGQVLTLSVVVPEFGIELDPQKPGTPEGLMMDIYTHSTTRTLDIRILSGSVRAPVTVRNIVLYEGEYTAETLPEYQPKGYGVELTACQRYCVLIPHTVEGFIIGYGVASTDTVAYITVDLPETVQEYTNVMPTIMGTFQLRGNGDIIDVDSVVCYSVNGHKLVLECRVSSGLASMQFYVLRALENVLISKEL